MNFKTTRKHYNIFKKSCQRWLSTFGLLDWRIEFAHEDWEGARAYAFMNLPTRGATLGISTHWDIEPDDQAVDICALHETLHLLTTPILEKMKDRNTPPAQLEEAEHSLIRLMETLYLQGKLKQ